MKHSLALCLFTTTKGHFGCKSLYQITVDRILSQYNFPVKVAHIKISPHELEEYDKMAAWLTKRGFNVSFTRKNTDWKHFDYSHQEGLIEDIHSLITQPILDNIEYMFWLEDDWVFRTNTPISFQENIDNAINLLQQEPKFLTYRFVRVDDKEIVQRTHAIPIVWQNQILFIQQKEFTFNPNISRVPEQRLISAHTLQSFFPYVSGHSEMAYTLACRSIYPNSNFMFPHDNHHAVKPIHIGWEQTALKVIDGSFDVDKYIQSV